MMLARKYRNCYRRRFIDDSLRMLRAMKHVIAGYLNSRYHRVSRQFTLPLRAMIFAASSRHPFTMMKPRSGRVLTAESRDNRAACIRFININSRNSSGTTRHSILSAVGDVIFTPPRAVFRDCQQRKLASPYFLIVDY